MMRHVRRGLIRSVESYAPRVPRVPQLATRRALSSRQTNLREQLVVPTQQWTEGWVTLVDFEQGAETAGVQARLAKWSKRRLKAEGLMLEGLMASPSAVAPGMESVLQFMLPGGAETDTPDWLPGHRFSSGDAVIVCRGSPQNTRFIEGQQRLEGIVLNVTPAAIRVRISSGAGLPDDIYSGLWRLDRGSNAVSTERQKQALARFSDDEEAVCDPRLQLMLLNNEKLMKSANTDIVKLSREPPSGTPVAFRRTESGEFESNSDKVTSMLESANLNESQRLAVRSALSQRVTLIQGPPGTGKTHTAVQLLRMLVEYGDNAASRGGKGGRNRKKKTKTQSTQQERGSVLAVANSNTAADNLLEGLLRQGVHAVRVGQLDRVRPHLHSATLHNILSSHQAQPIVGQLEDMIRSLSAELSYIDGGQAADEIQQSIMSARLPGRMQALTNAMAFDANAVTAHSRPRSRADIFVKLERARGQLDLLRKEMVSEVFSSTSVVVATCIAAGELTEKFKVVLVDEASQATEPTCLVPISKGCRQLILVGDANQLPPTVKTGFAVEGGLNYSLFERFQDAGVPAIMLDTQYRMHSAISAFPAKHFYGGMLRDADNVTALVPPAGYNWPQTSSGILPVSFVPVVDGKEMASTDGTSKTNRKEADAVFDILKAVLDAGDVLASDVGIVTPYKGQVELLRKMIEESAIAGLEINSVDGFQGREKELIIFSAVRSNEFRKVGFLADWRRLNVALTRARRGLIVCGNPDTLAADETWSNWLSWAAASGAYDAAPMEASQSEPPGFSDAKSSGEEEKKQLQTANC